MDKIANIYHLLGYYSQWSVWCLMKWPFKLIHKQMSSCLQEICPTPERERYSLSPVTYTKHCCASKSKLGILPPLFSRMQDKILPALMHAMYKAVLHSSSAFQVSPSWWLGKEWGWPCTCASTDVESILQSHSASASNQLLSLKAKFYQALIPILLPNVTSCRESTLGGSKAREVPVLLHWFEQLLLFLETNRGKKAMKLEMSLMQDSKP